MGAVLWERYCGSGTLEVLLWKWYFGSGTLEVVLWKWYFRSSILSLPSSPRRVEHCPDYQRLPLKAYSSTSCVLVPKKVRLEYQFFLEV